MRDQPEKDDNIDPMTVADLVAEIDARTTARLARIAARMKVPPEDLARAIGIKGTMGVTP